MNDRKEVDKKEIIKRIGRHLRLNQKNGRLPSTEYIAN